MGRIRSAFALNGSVVRQRLFLVIRYFCVSDKSIGLFLSAKFHRLFVGLFCTWVSLSISVENHFESASQ